MVEYLGYLASLIVLISLLMKSIKKLRWINLVGALLFSIYGLFINSLPVAFMNFAIVIININFLVKMYMTKDYFKTLNLEKESEFLNYFIDYNKDSINEFEDLAKVNVDSSIKLLVLRNTIPAGIFICSKVDESTLKIELDYVVTEYRDFKIGNYIFKDNRELFTSQGYEKFIVKSDNEKHIDYLFKMGFKLEDNVYTKMI